MQAPPPLPDVDYHFPHYLAAKKSIDDRSLNQRVWERLLQELPHEPGAPPLRVLEAGCGIGTMAERLVTWGLSERFHYTGIDAQAENINAARERMSHWGGERGFKVRNESDGAITLEQGKQHFEIRLEAGDIFDFIARQEDRERWDLLVAHAFLDLVDTSTTLVRLFDVLVDGGLFYFTLNFDGLTVFEPVIDPALDDLILSLYHRTMDERLMGGVPSGDSRTGRRLFAILQKAGSQILEVGASDWVVYPRAGGYSQQEAYFLHFIVHTIHEELKNHPGLEPIQLDEWVARRHSQIQHNELVYLAHQLDFVGRVHHSSGAK